MTSAFLRVHTCVIIFEDGEAITMFLFFSVLFILVGPIDAAAGAARGAGVCRVACTAVGW